MAKRLTDLTGKVIGKLTVLRQAQNSTPGDRWWICRCQCGRIISSRYPRGSCSIWCTRIKSASAFGKILNQYKRDARQRGLAWELTEQQFEILILSPCHYTGRQPMQSMVVNGKMLLYNGIDRLDNFIGYTWENCVPCCHEVNMMKKSFPYATFISLCREVTHPKISTKKNRGLVCQ